MSITTRIAAGAALLIGGIGVLLTAQGLFFVFSFADRARRELPVAIDEVTDVGRIVERQSNVVVRSLSLAREHTTAVQVALEEFSARDRPSTRDGVSSASVEFRQRMTTAEEFLASLQGTIRGMSGMLLLVESVPFVSTQTAGGTESASLGALSGDLTETANTLSEVSTHLSEVRAGRPIESQQFEAAIDSLESVNGQLRVAEGDMQAFVERLEGVVDNMESWSGRIDATVLRLQLAAATFLVCFGASQIALAASGYRRLRQIGTARQHEGSKQ